MKHKRWVVNCLLMSGDLNRSMQHFDQRAARRGRKPGCARHCGGELIVGHNNCQIATLVERCTRYVMLAKVNRSNSETVINALIKHSSNPMNSTNHLPGIAARKWQIQRSTLATNIDVYSCDPRSPWQRGSNENTNGLLRQCFRKVTDLSVHSQAKLNAVASQLNERPRETLGFETPAERFNQCVASTS